MLQLYQWSKKIHRVLVLIISVLVLIMTYTGTLLKYPAWAKYVGSPDLGKIRYLHNNLSPYLTIVLMLMMVTGLVMYFYPMYTLKRAKKNQAFVRELKVNE